MFPEWHHAVPESAYLKVPETLKTRRVCVCVGGGVILAIKSDIIHEPITTPTQLEMTATKIHLNNNKHIS